MNRSARLRRTVSGHGMPCPYNARTTHFVRTKFGRPIAAFSIIRITRGHLRFAAGMCRKYCWAETTKRFAGGGGVAHWRRLGAIVPSCWMGRGLARRIADCWVRLPVACETRDRMQRRRFRACGRTHFCSLRWVLSPNQCRITWMDAGTGVELLERTAMNFFPSGVTSYDGT